MKDISSDHLFWHMKDIKRPFVLGYLRHQVMTEKLLHEGLGAFLMAEIETNPFLRHSRCGASITRSKIIP